MTVTDGTTTPMVLQLGRARASSLDLPAALSAVCASLPGSVGVAGAVILLVDGAEACFASDGEAGWIGETQRRAGSGPLPNALRTGRSVMTADMTRIGPPELAASSAQCGLTSSLVLPLEIDGTVLGGLQLLGDVGRPVAAAHAHLVRPLVEVLAARIADVRDLESLRAARPEPAPVPGPVHPGDMATRTLPAVPRPRRAPESSSGPSPSPRAAPRHAQPGAAARPVGEVGRTARPGRHGR